MRTQEVLALLLFIFFILAYTFLDVYVIEDSVVMFLLGIAMLFSIGLILLFLGGGV